MKFRIVLFQALAIFLIVNVSYAQEISPVPINEVFYVTENNYTSMCNEYSSYSTYPRSVNTDGTIRMVQTWDWTSGFFPGGLWYLYENTGNVAIKENAISRTAPIANQRYNTGTHDLGFMLFCSFGNALRITDDSAYELILLDAANSLMTRYNSTVGCIRSWDFGTWEFPVIIDNMMNLELLFWATSYTKDSSYYHAAVDHAETTIENHFRVDNSSYHVVDYNKTTGAVIAKSTHQGYSDESHWARGQAWGLYGYTMCYKETGDPIFLNQAQKIADFYIGHSNMPEDKIPYWDFLAPGIPSEPRDASAACVAASALLDLSVFSESGDQYFEYAEQTLINLSSPEYFSFDNTEMNFLLKQSTGSKPSNSEVNTSIIYADYYFLEALGRYRSISNKLNKPYIVSSDEIVVYAENSLTDNILVYDIDKRDYSLSLENNPGFVQVNKVDDENFEIVLSPASNDVGNYEISLLLSDASGGETVITKQIFVEENNFPDLAVSASHSINDHLPEHTLDGYLSTYWESDLYGSNLIYDLGDEFIIDTVSIAFYNREGHKYSFSVFSSLDAINWTIELYGTSSGDDLVFENFLFQEPERLRYVKIIAYGSDIDDISRYAEIRFSKTEQSAISQQYLDKDIILDYELLNNYLILKGGSKVRIVAVDIYNMLGAHLVRHEVRSPVEQLSISVDELDRGFYVANISLESGEFRSVKFQTR